MAKKKINNNSKPSLEEQYKSMRSLYEIYTQKIELLIKTLIDESDIKAHSITSRTKEAESFADKVSSKVETYKRVSNVNDLSGVRICCYFSSQVDKVAEMIKKNFIIIPELSVDKRETIDPDKFGYLSLHYVVKLSDKRAKLPEYKKYKDLLCEIQIRTILQHAWAEIEHDLGYKSSIETPREIRRRFSRLASLLELADEEFEIVKNQIEKYSTEIEEKITTAPIEVEIDNISMETYLLTSPIVKEIDEKISKMGNFKLSEKTQTKFSVKMSYYFNIKSIQELENVIKNEKENIINFSTQFLKEKPYEPEEEIVNRGISLFYLGYILAAKSKNIDSIIDYFKSIEIGDKGSWKGLASELINIINKVINK